VPEVLVLGVPEVLVPKGSCLAAAGAKRG